MSAHAATDPNVNYINRDWSLKSWLLTVDHKRIAWLYLLSTGAFFAAGGFFAMLVRLELLTPAGDLFSPDVYNRAFTQHGVIMVFLFLIPSIPAVLGNFLVPLMVGAIDVAFPRLNLLSWYIYTVAGVMVIVALVSGGVDTGWTFYTPLSSTYANSQVMSREFVIQCSTNIAMVVPVSGIQRYEAHSCFDKSTSEQCLFSPAVAIAELEAGMKRHIWLV